MKQKRKMIKIFVVNLKSSVQRRKIMERQLNDLGLPFEIFEAIKGDEVTKDEIERYYDMDFYKNRPDYFTAGAVGCTLSHYLIYKKMVEEKIEIALILEDDMAINKEFPKILPQLAKEIRNHEVILLFYQSYFPINLSFSSKRYLAGKYHLYQAISTGGLRSTAGYLINLRTAKSMVDGLIPYSTFPDDWEIFYHRKLLNGIRIVHPFILNNTYEQTTISPNLKGGNLGKKTTGFIEKNKIFPFYQLLKFRRMINISKSRRCFTLNESPTDYRENNFNK